MANGQNTYNLTQGLAAGVDGFFRGKQLADQDAERERRARMDEERLARQQALDQRANEDYEYRKGLRPQQEKAAELGMLEQERQAKLQEMQIEEAMRSMKQNGSLRAMEYLYDGMPDMALSDSGPEVAKNTRAFVPHRDQKKAKEGWWIAINSQGEEAPIHPESILRRVGKLKESDEKMIATDKPIYNPNTGKWIEPPKGMLGGGSGADGEGGGGQKPGVYQTRDGIPIKHEQLVAQYRIENNFPDDMALMLMDPARADAIRKKMEQAKPFAEWAAERGVVGVPSVSASGGQGSNEPKQGKDGKFYIPDPSRPGKYLRVDPPEQDGGMVNTESRRRLATPEQKAASAARKSVPSDQQSNRMASGFGLRQEASVEQRGTAYNQMAKAYSKVENDLREGFLPDETDLVSAMQFALGKGDQNKAAIYRKVLDDNYGAR